MISKSSGFKKYSLLMIFGGALGNVFDRIIYRAVPDFIDLKKTSGLKKRILNLLIIMKKII